MTSFCRTRLLVKGKLVNLCCTREQIKLVKGILVVCMGLKTCPAVHTSKVITCHAKLTCEEKECVFIVHTGTSKATKELVKENLVVCVRGSVNFRHFSLCTVLINFTLLFHLGYPLNLHNW